MAQHKWHKEIKAWADGAEIEHRWQSKIDFCWFECIKPIDWDNELIEYRIKPQPKVNEFAHIPYWLCCGSVSPHLHHSFCSEAKAGYPERCRFGTAEEHQKRMEKPPQPKEPQYLYVYQDIGKLVLERSNTLVLDMNLIGKIKLED